MFTLTLTDEELNRAVEAHAVIMGAVEDAVAQIRVQQLKQTEVVTASQLPLWERQWATRVGVSLAADFIATTARKTRVTTATAGQLSWPAGWDGPATVQELFDQFPTTFAGVDPMTVGAVLASPTWLATFDEYLLNTRNLIVGMPDSIFRQTTIALQAVHNQGLFEQQRAVRQFLSWEGEGGYVGWMRRAERIARTEVQTARQTALWAAANLEAESGRVMVKRWKAHIDDRTRLAHSEADLQTRPIDQPFEVGGELLDHPKDRAHGSPGNVIQCRCTVDYMEKNIMDDIDRKYPDLKRMDDTALQDYMDTLLASAAGSPWRGVLAPLGKPTGDGRMIAADATIRFRDFPLPLLWQEHTSEGHDTAKVVGVIEDGEVTDSEITGVGHIYEDEAKVLQLLADGVARPSVDLCDVVAEFDEEAEQLVITSATVMATTLVATPAFEDVTVELVAGGHQFDAGVFRDPGLLHPTSVTVTDDGRVFGHIACWDTCHTGMAGRCVTPPHSATDYAVFRQSTVETTEGRLRVGRLTVGGGHASPNQKVTGAVEHYDTTGACWAFVNVGEDEHGIWVSGVVNPAATREQLQAASTAPVSGDWRRVGNGLELVAVLSVSVPGFPVWRQFSTDGGVLDTVVASTAPEVGHWGRLEQVLQRKRAHDFAVLESRVERK